MSVSAPIQSVEEKAIPNFELAQLLHRYTNSHTTSHATSHTTSHTAGDAEALVDSIMAIVSEDNMAPLYSSLCDKFQWAVDNDKLAAMRASNADELAALEKEAEDAAVNAGDLEQLDAMLKKGRYHARIGEWANATALFETIAKKDKATSGRKIDAHFERAKVALFNSDLSQLKDCLVDAGKLVESGGDWDRRNKLKVFEALHAMMTRDFRKASSLLLDGIATFSSTELCSYGDFIFYSVLTNLLLLPRNELKKKIIDNAHVISALIDARPIRDLVEQLYACDYRGFMRQLVAVEATRVLPDRYLGQHSAYLMREFRVLAFQQFLGAYKSITLSSMAAAFGMPTEVIDKELSHFIATGRLGAKIDKVGDIVETVRSDRKNAQYQEVVKKGDALLNQIQKLVRVIDH